MSDEAPEAAPAAAATPPASRRSVRAPAPVERLERAVADWISRHIHDSPVSRATEAYNHLLDKLEELKSARAKEL